MIEHAATHHRWAVWTQREEHFVHPNPASNKRSWTLQPLRNQPYIWSEYMWCIRATLPSHPYPRTQQHLMAGHTHYRDLFAVDYLMEGFSCSRNSHSRPRAQIQICTDLAIIIYAVVHSCGSRSLLPVTINIFPARKVTPSSWEHLSSLESLFQLADVKTPHSAMNETWYTAWIRVTFMKIIIHPDIYPASPQRPFSSQPSHAATHCGTWSGPSRQGQSPLPARLMHLLLDNLTSWFGLFPCPVPMNRRQLQELKGR